MKIHFKGIDWVPIMSPCSGHIPFLFFDIAVCKFVSHNAYFYG